MREKCSNTEFFWSVFSRIRTEYREIRSISPYSVRIQAYTEQKKLRILETFHAVIERKSNQTYAYAKYVKLIFENIISGIQLYNKKYHQKLNHN